MAAAPVGKDVAAIKRLLQVFDQAALAPAQQALRMLEDITKLVAKAPAAYDLLDDPGDASAWQQAGGEAFCENHEFTNKLAARWLEVLGRPDLANAGLDKDDLLILGDRLKRWAAAITETGLEFGEPDELAAKLEELREAAPEAEEDSSSEEGSDD